MIHFVVTPTPPDQFSSRSKQAGFRNLQRLLEKIIGFLKAHQPEATAYLALGNGTPELFLVVPSGPYDFELGDKLSDFAAPYIERGMLGGASLLPVSSQEELVAYFDPAHAIRTERVR
jgi:hypothetical protein